MRNIGERIQIQRKRLGLTQQELGNKLEISLNGIKKLETNRIKPSIETIVKLCAIFNCTSDYILGINSEDDSGDIQRYKLERVLNAIQKIRSETDINNNKTRHALMDEYFDSVNSAEIRTSFFKFLNDPSEHMSMTEEIVIKKLEELK